jgi:type VI secretion system secreted protein VgrG
VSTPVRFHALTGSDVSAKECLQTFICRHKSLPGTVRLKDHDYSKPRLRVGGSAPVTKHGLGEISVHGARFFTPEAGKRLATLRAEEMLAREVLFTGSGTSFYLRAGYTFALEDHPRQSFDTTYLAIEVEHLGNQGASTPELRKLTGLDTDEVYRVDVTAIPAPVQFRAELRTAWPRIYGTEHGTIDGEAESEYAQIDEHGRYVVRFAFDESILGNGKASTRVRMMQPHGGGVEGWHFPLRKGTEVLFTFLGGDPDRPVIAGVVPNALTPSAVTSGNHTKNIIQTGGRNRLEIEDRAGQQRITLSTPYSNTYLRMGAPNADHELILHTSDNALLKASQDWDVVVGKNLTEEVTGTTNETYRGDHTTQSWSYRTVEIGKLYTQNCHTDVVRKVYGDSVTTVVGNVTEDFGSKMVTILGTTNETHQGSHSTKSLSTRTVEVHGAHDETSLAGRTSTVVGDWAQNVTGHVKVNGAQVTVKAGFYKGISSPSFEGFTSKNTAGVQAFTATQLKMDLTGSSFSLAVIKGDNASAKKVDTGVMLEAVGSHVKTAATAILNAGLKVQTCGFSKM